MNNPYANNHRDDYLRNQVLSASPSRLIEMLIERAIKDVKQAKIALDNKDIQATNKHILHAQDIVTELKADVDLKVEGDVPKQIVAMYNLLENNLIRANVNKDQEHLDIALSMLTDWLDTWQQVSKQA
ncbi:flagellar protein FliS [Ligilactobacillus sp. WC1T17]|jgi:flagellar protein FliS|uniref:Flagellar secretion chaperone FliS n=1 Tax=Ligilactobacillus ruminis TaxID=1623 RepID=A0ABY1ADS7_9LACO|nr:flagellar protein FliS [Ligilactobacillus ruminis]